MGHSVVTYERINKQLNYEGYGLFRYPPGRVPGQHDRGPADLPPRPPGPATFTTAGGLVLTAASGATATIPTGALVLGGLAAKKLALLKILEAQQQEAPRHH